jgi:acyl-CoA reductase-like NAD-dependent aldehyde dehydrogenase
VSDYTMTIGGGAVDSDLAFGVINPARGELFANAPQCSPAQLDDAFDAALRASGEWRIDEVLRRKLLIDAGDALIGAADELSAVLTAEQGKPLSSAKGEIVSAGECLKYFAGLEIPVDVLFEDNELSVRVVRRPLGVVAAITPWNFPITLAVWKIAPALLAGNTMVLKPSPFTPLATLAMGALLADVLPPGVLNVVSGGNELGAQMTAHAVPRKISFTGSVATGKRVALSAAQDLKRVTLELGGNDPAIVLDDADPGVIAKRIFWGAFSNNGQICAAIKRVYVPESLHDELVEALVDVARDVVVGDGADEGTQLGPLNNRPQFERVRGLVLDAIQGGAVAAIGGHPMPGSGYFFEPTILTNVHDGVRIVDEEQFGPALPIVKYRDIDEVVGHANATHFGLQGSVWSSDVERASQVAERLECGTSYVNAHLAMVPNQPFGGVKWSGVGVENGPMGLEQFSDVQVLYTRR